MSSILSTPAQAATTAVDDTIQKNALPGLVTKLEEEAIDRVAQIDPMGIGSTVTQPTISWPLSTFSQYAWPSLPAPLETTSTEADVTKDASEAYMNKPEGKVNVEVVRVADDIPILR